MTCLVYWDICTPFPKTGWFRRLLTAKRMIQYCTLITLFKKPWRKAQLEGRQWKLLTVFWCSRNLNNLTHHQEDWKCDKQCFSCVQRNHYHQSYISVKNLSLSFTLLILLLLLSKRTSKHRGVLNISVGKEVRLPGPQTLTLFKKKVVQFLIRCFKSVPCLRHLPLKRYLFKKNKKKKNKDVNVNVICLPT